MKCFTFEVEYDQTIWQQVDMEMEHRGTRRNTTTFVVVAEDRVIAEREVIDDRHFYRHQNPVIKGVTETNVNVVVVVQRA
jgi:hypothetical protein